jgi:DNA-binding HxlR family transcriptional regulator
MIEYSQFCPVSKTAEVLGEKWALLIVRELVLGATRFSQIQRAIPRMSPTILNKRLAELQTHGVIVRKRIPQQKGFEYHLTESGRELYPLILQMAQWGMRWARSTMTDDELDVELLMADVQRRLDPSKLPGGRTVLKFNYTDLRDFAEWWIKISGGNVELCLDDPGGEVDVYFTTTLRTMTEVWMGDVSLRKAQADGRLRIVGASTLLRRIGSWFPLYLYADIRPKQRNV